MLCILILHNSFSLTIFYTKQNIIRGALIYATGDTIAALILGDFSWLRLVGMMIVGGTFYAYEIPNYFGWIERRIKKRKGSASSFYKTFLAMLYFNPIWIARHMFFIILFSQKPESLSWGIFLTATWSFLFNIPISIIGNYIIQNPVPLKWRFAVSATFSSLLAIYYAMSMVWFD